MPLSNHAKRMIVGTVLTLSILCNLFFFWVTLFGLAIDGWQGNDQDWRRFLFVPSYIRNLPRIQVIEGSLHYRTSENDVACINYESRATGEELLAQIKTYLLEQGFTQSPNPELPSQYFRTNPESEASLYIEPPRRNLGAVSLLVCDLFL